MNLIEILFSLQGKSIQEIRNFVHNACDDGIQNDILECFDVDGNLVGIPIDDEDVPMYAVVEKE